MLWMDDSRSSSSTFTIDKLQQESIHWNLFEIRIALVFARLHSTSYLTEDSHGTAEGNSEVGSTNNGRWVYATLCSVQMCMDRMRRRKSIPIPAFTSHTNSIGGDIWCWVLFLWIALGGSTHTHITNLCQYGTCVRHYKIIFVFGNRLSCSMPCHTL